VIVALSVQPPGFNELCVCACVCVSKSPKEQFEKLLLQPLLDLSQLDQQPPTAVIVIDALDECEHEQDIRNITRLLPRLQMVKAVRLRIFLSSWPKLPISLEFSDIANREYQDRVGSDRVLFN
jgi:hypothetical protein